MSFSTDTKNELARVMPEKKCCELAEIAGFLRVSGSIRLAGGGQLKIVMSTDSAAAARHYKTLIEQYFHISTELSIEDGGALRGGYLYTLTIEPEMRSEAVLRETGILMIREGSNYITDGIYDSIVRTKCCRRAYLRGTFMGAGTVSSPDKAYDLEFVVTTKRMAEDLKKLIGSFEDLSARVTERRGRYVVYMKNAQYISDTLALMGAHSQVLKMEDVRIRKDLVNQTVRITNCDAANTDRVIDASERQLAAIRSLRESGRFGSLSEKLQDLAVLREEHPEASLTELGEMMNPPLKKSGVNNRMKRILNAAEKA